MICSLIKSAAPAAGLRSDAGQMFDRLESGILAGDDDGTILERGICQ